MKKILFGGLVVLLLVIVGGLFYLASNLDSIVAQIIEKQGGEVTDTQVAVSGVDISLKEGRGSISGLTIDSPAGFAARQAFSLGGIVVDIDLKSVRKEPIVIEEIRVEAPVVNAEIHKDGSSNIMALNRNVKEFAARSGAGDGDSGTGGSAEKDEKRIRIKRFVFEKGRIEIDASDLGLEAQTVDLPAIRLDDIGGSQGAPPSKIALAVLGALTKEAAATVAKAGVEEKVKDAVKDEAEKQGNKLLDKIGG